MSVPLFNAATTINVIVAYLFAAILVLIVGRMLVTSLRGVGGILVKAGVSFALLLAMNVIGASIGYTVPINMITVAVPTFLGLPGLLLVSVLQYLLG